MAKIRSTLGAILPVGDTEVVDLGFGICHHCGRAPAVGLFSGHKEKLAAKTKAKVKEKASLYRGYLCEECAATFARGRFVGRSKMYRGADWKRQRLRARRRDNYACRCCDKTKKELGKHPNIHHIIPYRLSLSNELDNLICLCPKCHSIADSAWRALEVDLQGDVRGVSREHFFCAAGKVGYRYVDRTYPDGDEQDTDERDTDERDTVEQDTDEQATE
jgi:5-methylcytosine-specific restriction endonuclease McrA